MQLWRPLVVFCKLSRLSNILINTRNIDTNTGRVIYYINCHALECKQCILVSFWRKNFKTCINLIAVKYCLVLKFMSLLFTNFEYVSIASIKYNSTSGQTLLSLVEKCLYIFLDSLSFLKIPANREIINSLASRFCKSF